MVKYIVDHIPKTTPCNRRPGHRMAATSITIHNTGNPTSTAAGERKNLTRVDNDRTASFHIVVDEHQAIECLPLSESAWHSGDGSGPASGNRTSIGIEICESGNYARTLDRAVELVVSMLMERGWGVDRLRRHFDWSGKICPRLMYDGGKWTGWTEFKERVKKAMDPKQERPIQEQPAKPIDDVTGHWAESAIREAQAAGLMSGFPDGSFRPDEAVTRAQLAAVLARLK